VGLRRKTVWNCSKESPQPYKQGRGRQHFEPLKSRSSPEGKGGHFNTLKGEGIDKNRNASLLLGEKEERKEEGSSLRSTLRVIRGERKRDISSIEEGKKEPELPIQKGRCSCQTFKEWGKKEMNFLKRKRFWPGGISREGERRSKHRHSSGEKEKRRRRKFVSRGD